MQLLLNIQRSYTSYESLRTVNNVTYGTFQDACYTLGLLADDGEFVAGIKEVALLASGMYIRRLFVTLLLSNSMSKPAIVWDQTWEILSDGIVYDRRRLLNNPELHIGMVELKNPCLIEVEKLLLSNGKSLKDFPNMPYPDHSPYNGFDNILLVNELQYDKEEMVNDHKKYFSTLTEEQRVVYDQVIGSIATKKGSFYFVYGYGGIGKTFVWKVLSSRLRSEGKVVLNVTSSGIESLLSFY